MESRYLGWHLGEMPWSLLGKRFNKSPQVNWECTLEKDEAVSLWTSANPHKRTTMKHKFNPSHSLLTSGLAM